MYKGFKAFKNPEYGTEQMFIHNNQIWYKKELDDFIDCGGLPTHLDRLRVMKRVYDRSVSRQK
jgi:hypothetical protein